MSVSLTTPDCKQQRGGSGSQEFANETVFDRNHQESGKTYLQTLRHSICAGERESVGVLSDSFLLSENNTFFRHSDCNSRLNCWGK